MKMLAGLSRLPKVLLTSAACAVLASCGGGTTVGSPTTVMVYMIGSDLESGRDGPASGGMASGNLQEMIEAQLPPGSHVVIETGGAKQTERAGSPVPDWTNVRRHNLVNGSLQEVANLGSVDMATSTSLSDFITWAQNTYPADQYRLVLWDHGGGWQGYGSDENAGHNIKLPVLSSALEIAAARTGIHFDMIGFDACLMGTLEAADALRPYANYLLASEEVEPGPGWNWTTFVNHVDDDAVSFGKIVIDDYTAKQAGSRYAGITTLSLIDMSKIPAVKSALLNFTSSLQGITSNRTAFTQLASARRLAPAFGTNQAKYYSEVDIGRFADLSASNGMSVSAANQLATAARSAVIYAKNGSYYQDATGLAMYFPSSSNVAEAMSDQYSTVGFDATYRNFVSDYVTKLDTLVSTISVDSSASTSTTLNAVIGSGYGVASVDLTLISAVAADGTQTVVGTMPLTFGGTLSGTEARLLASAPLSGKWLTLNGYPVIFGELSRNGANDQESAGLYGIPVDIDGTAAYLVAQLMIDGTYTLVGTMNADAYDVQSPGVGRIASLPDATQQVTVLGASYNPTTQKFGSLSASSPAFAAGDLTLNMTTLASAGYQEGVLVTDNLNSAQMSTLVARP